MIKPVTFNSAANFKSNLFAVDTKMRMLDPYNMICAYYGECLKPTVIANDTIKIGSGILYIQGRMIEIVESETIKFAYAEGHVGQVICRIETKPSESGKHCSLLVKTAETHDLISLTKEDTFAYASESDNKVYEAALYSFSMQNGEILTPFKTEIPSITPIEKLGQDISYLEERLTKMGFMEGSVQLSLPDGWSATENILTRQGNYVLGSLKITPSVFSPTSAEWEKGKIHLGTLHEQFRPKEYICFGVYNSMNFSNIFGTDITIESGSDYSVYISFLQTGEVILNLEGSETNPQLLLLYCNFGFEATPL